MKQAKCLLLVCVLSVAQRLPALAEPVSKPQATATKQNKTTALKSKAKSAQGLAARVVSTVRTLELARKPFLPAEVERLTGRRLAACEGGGDGESFRAEWDEANLFTKVELDRPGKTFKRNFLEVDINTHKCFFRPSHITAIFGKEDYTADRSHDDVVDEANIEYKRKWGRLLFLFSGNDGPLHSVLFWPGEK